MKPTYTRFATIALGDIELTQPGTGPVIVSDVRANVFLFEGRVAVCNQHTRNVEYPDIPEVSTLEEGERAAEIYYQDPKWDYRTLEEDPEA